VWEGPIIQAACASSGHPKHKTLAFKQAKGKGGQMVVNKI
jgi:hypothetical protein